MSSIVIEVIRTVYYYFFIKIFCTQKKNTQALFKYLNTLKKHNKAHKQLLFKCKAINVLLKYTLKKIWLKQDAMNNFLLRYMLKNKMQ